jgi:hypothetical protein
VVLCEALRLTYFPILFCCWMGSRVADPHHITADPDPAFHYDLCLDPDTVLVLFKVMGICD